MTTYGELDLKKIRDELGLDFAHYTYRKGQCSCCYGPKDMALKYWRDRVIPDHNNYKSILFKNAYNGSGRIKDPSEPIRDYTCIEHTNLTHEELLKVAQKLADQLDKEYTVYVPADSLCTMIILWSGGEYFKKHKADLKKQKDKNGAAYWTPVRRRTRT